MLTLKEIRIADEERAKHRIYCKNCGHSQLLGKQEKVPCSHCRNYIFKDDAAEFKYRMKEKMIKVKKNDSNNNI